MKQKGGLGKEMRGRWSEGHGRKLWERKSEKSERKGL